MSKENEVTMVYLTPGEAKLIVDTLGDMLEEVAGMADWGFPLTVLEEEQIEESKKVLEHAIATQKLKEAYNECK